MNHARLGVVCLLLASAPILAEPAIRAAKFELFVADVDVSIAFYRALGFQVAHRKVGDDYTTLRHGSTVVALSPLPGWLPVHWIGFLRHPPLGTEIVFYSTALEGHREALRTAGFDPGDIRLQPWGDRDFRITDPDGYYVRVSEGGAIPATAGEAYRDAPSGVRSSRPGTPLSLR